MRMVRVYACANFQREGEMGESYWQRFGDKRIGRRRALAIAGATAGGAALLAACGSSGSGGSGKTGDKSGLVTTPVDTTKEAKRGGTIKDYIRGEPATLDP